MWGGRAYEMATNSLGLRDRTVREITLKPEWKRTVVIGDSMIEGLGVEYEECVAAQLERLWAHEQIEVINAGVVSYSPKLYDLKIEHLLRQGFEFDRLVVFVDVSDIQDETFYAEFETGSGTGSFGEIASWWQSRSLLGSAIKRFTGERTIDNKFRTDADIHVWMENTKVLANAGEEDPEFGRWEWTINDEFYQDWGKRGSELAVESMNRLVRACDDRNIHVTVVVYPSPYQIYADDLDSRQVRLWQTFCESSGCQFVNLFPAFMEWGTHDEIYQQFFIPEDVHWRPEGHRFVAEQVARQLSRP